MLTISKPLTANQALAYHSKEFTNSEQSYYTQGDQVQGEWTGRLAEEWGLRGRVNYEQFERLANAANILSLASNSCDIGSHTSTRMKTAKL